MSNLLTDHGINWHYEISSKGEPIVFIHGFGGSSQWWWQQQSYFENNHQVITVDLPGHGQSSWKMVGLSDMAADIRQILDQVHLEQHINVVASSFGGLVALELHRLI